MKKIIYISLGIVALISVAFVIKNLNEPKVDENIPNIKASTEEEIISKMDSDESFLLVIGSSICSTCKDYKNGTLQEYINQESTIPLMLAYTDESFLTEAAFETFLDTYHIEYDYSPTSYLIQNGEVVNSLEGNIDLDTLNQLVNQK